MKKILLLLVVLLTTVSSSWAQKHSVIPNGGYLFGVAINFSDSTVYISPIQQLADLTYDQKNGVSGESRRILKGNFPTL